MKITETSVRNRDLVFCFPGDVVLDSDNEEAVNDDQWEDIEESDEEENEEDQSPMDHSYKYSKTCLKRPLKKKTKNWFSRPIIA